MCLKAVEAGTGIVPSQAIAFVNTSPTREMKVAGARRQLVLRVVGVHILNHHFAANVGVVVTNFPVDCQKHCCAALARTRCHPAVKKGCENGKQYTGDVLRTRRRFQR